MMKFAILNEWGQGKLTLEEKWKNVFNEMIGYLANLIAAHSIEKQSLQHARKKILERDCNRIRDMHMHKPRNKET